MKTKNNCNIKTIIDDLEMIRSCLKDIDSDGNIFAQSRLGYCNGKLLLNIGKLKELDIWFDPSYHFDK